MNDEKTEHGDEKLLPIFLDEPLDELFVFDNPSLQEIMEKLTDSSAAHLKAGEPLIETLLDDTSRGNYECSMTPRYQAPALFGITTLLGKNLEGNILYVASSYGLGMKLIHDAGYKNIQGVDIDEKAVEFCKKQGLNATVMDASNTNFSDNSFDVTVSRDFLEKSYLHYDHKMVSFLDEQYRLLKKGGFAIFTSLSSCLSDGTVLDMNYPHKAVIDQSRFSDSKKSQKFVEIRSKDIPKYGGAVYCIEVYEK